MLLLTQIDVDTGYGTLLPAFVLMGIGMALVMSPMSTAAMNAVPPQKAGVGSGMLSMSRMVGGTFGVAAIGALFQYLSRSYLHDHLAGTGIAAGQREQHRREPRLGQQRRRARRARSRAGAPGHGGRASDAFIHALVERHVAVGGRLAARCGHRAHR